jgi:hypothetical protein
MMKVGCWGFPIKREIYYRSFNVVEIQKILSKGEKNHPRGRRFSNPFKGEGRWIEK